MNVVISLFQGKEALKVDAHKALNSACIYIDGNMGNGVSIFVQDVGSAEQLVTAAQKALNILKELCSAAEQPQP